jgi:hypothetical protein
MRAWLAVLVCLAAPVAATASNGVATPPDVLVIGDSIATGMYWHGLGVVQANLNVVWDVAVCRTIAGTSCPYEGERPPTLLDAVAARRTVPPTVVLVVGYNDPARSFAHEVDEAMSALVAAGAKNVVWFTLEEAQSQYAAMNRLLAKAQMRWPQLVLVDWNAASYNHGSWFQSDGEHVTYLGGVAMAHLAHRAVMQILDPLRLPTVPLWLRAGRSYTLRLRPEGGTPPYRWRVAAGRPPRGFHLRSNGSLTTEGARGSGFVLLSVTDVDGATAELPVLTS